jgi:NAD(P)-dependent dehydrogenase (short-subunit alcohol dehydrogenase family)
MLLEGRTALITGGTAGIGRAIAAAFVHGATLPIDGGRTAA